MGQRRRPLRGPGRRGERRLRVPSTPAGAARRGTLCEETFTASPEAAAALPRRPLPGRPGPGAGPLLDRQRRPRSTTPSARARYGGRAPPRGGGETDLLGDHLPAFHPHARGLPRLLRLRARPETGQPDLEKLGAFLGAHPESQPAVQATSGPSRRRASPSSPTTRRTPSSSSSRRRGDLVRYRWRPEAGEARSPTTRPRARPRLPARGAGRAASRRAAGFDCCSSSRRGRPDRRPDGLWPETASSSSPGASRSPRSATTPRPTVTSRLRPDPVVDGIELSDDPILHARARAYTISPHCLMGVEVREPCRPRRRSPSNRHGAAGDQALSVGDLARAAPAGAGA